MSNTPEEKRLLEEQNLAILNILPKLIIGIIILLIIFFYVGDIVFTILIQKPTNQPMV